MVASLSDLRYAYFGGGSAAEYDFLSQAQAQGVTASSTLNKLLGSAQDIAARSVVGVGSLDIPNCSITVQPYPKPFLILWTGYQYNGTAAGPSDLQLCKADNTLLMNGYFTSAIANAIDMTTHVFLSAAIAIATTYKLKLSNQGAGTTANVLGSATTPTQIVAVGL